MATVDEYLLQIRDLTIVPPVLMSVLSIQDDNEVSFGEIEKKVQTDQVLVARLLKLANSPFFSRGNAVANMKQVITRLGFKTVRSMVAMAMTDSLFSKGNYKKFRDEVWDHSIAKGIYAQMLCEQKKLKKEAELSLTCGLMQDLGKIVLNTIDRQKYVEVLVAYQTSDDTILSCEKKAFEVDSMEMGVGAAKLWKLPAPVIETMEEKSQTLENQKTLTKAIEFGGLLARLSGHGKMEIDTLDRFKNYAQFFEINPDSLETYPKEAGEKLLKNELYQFCASL